VSEELVDILLVEDSATDGELTQRALRKAGLGAQVVWVKDGQEAMDFLFGEGAYAGRSLRPRVVLLDLKLPRVDGLEVLRRLKSDPIRRMIPVVMLTSSNQERDVRACYAQGVNSYLVKPVEFAKLVEQVVSAGLYWLRSNHAPA
jgi:two-component system response regulator